MEVDTTLIALLVILFVGLVVPELFKKFKISFITLLILLGAVLGPFALNYVQLTEPIEFFGFLGMAFLMLMAGLETNILKIKKYRAKVLIMALLNGLIPFMVGVFITKYFGYSLQTSLLVGIVFISSSVAIIAPVLKSIKIFDKDIGQLVLFSVLITDIVSLIALGFMFQSISPVTKLPLGIYYFILILSIILIFWFVPKILEFILKKISEDLGYERKLRLVIVTTIGLLVFFSLLGVHPILAAFLSGLVLSGIVHHDKTGIIYSKIHTLGYGIFIPVFFFVIGMQMDLSLFRQFDVSNVLMIFLIFGLIISKLVSGYIAGRVVGFNSHNALIFGGISIVQLTTTLAVTYIAFSLEIFDNVIVTSIILLSIISVLVGPALVSFFQRNRK